MSKITEPGGAAAIAVEARGGIEVTEAIIGVTLAVGPIIDC